MLRVLPHHCRSGQEMRCVFRRVRFRGTFAGESIAFIHRRTWQSYAHDPRKTRDASDTSLPPPSSLAAQAHIIKSSVRKVPLPGPLDALRRLIVDRLIPHPLVLGAGAGVAMCAVAGEDGLELGESGLVIRL